MGKVVTEEVHGKPITIDMMENKSIHGWTMQGMNVSTLHKVFAD